MKYVDEREREGERERERDREGGRVREKVEEERVMFSGAGGGTLSHR